MEKSVPSRAYRGVLGSARKGAANLTEPLTVCLTTCLTRYLTHDLTKAGIRELRVGAKGSGDRREPVTALQLGGFKGLGNHAVMHPDTICNDVLP